MALYCASSDDIGPLLGVKVTEDIDGLAFALLSESGGTSLVGGGGGTLRWTE
jgi:hypothetical protein